MITSCFLSECKATFAYTIFSPSGIHTYPGDSGSRALGVILLKEPSFRVYTTSPIDSRTSFIAGHTSLYSVVGSLSLIRKPLLCKWSVMPVNKIVIGFISVCLCTPIPLDTDCIWYRSTAANIITSGQNRDLEVSTKSQFATIIILAFLISVCRTRQR